MWRGLARYRLPEDGPRVHSREEREYAKVTTLLETPLLECTYYHDVPGEQRVGMKRKPWLTLQVWYLRRQPQHSLTRPIKSATSSLRQSMAWMSLYTVV